MTLLPQVFAARAIDPDIQELLRTAPPPADYTTPIYRANLPISLPSFPTRFQQADDTWKSENFELIGKLFHIRIEKLEFKATPGRDALQWIAAQSVALDPKHKGITLVYDLDKGDKTAAGRILDQPITLSRSDVPLDLALTYVTEELKLRYNIERGAVVIRPAK